MIYYLGTDSNQVHVVKVVDDDNDSSGGAPLIVETIQTVETPNPRKLPSGVYNGVSTEWILRHPKHPLLYVMTSYWNLLSSCITTFQISKKNGRLTKLGERSTEGFQAGHAVFSPDGSLLVVAHHNDGALTFFDCRDSNGALEPPLMVLHPPEVVPGTRRQAQRNDGFPGLPSLHHVEYAPTNQNYLLAVDPSQDCIFTYLVDERGLPKAKVPTSIFQCHSKHSIYGLFQRVITKYVLKCNLRARKAMIHPNGKYVYILYEAINRIQVCSIDEKGVISTITTTTSNSNSSEQQQQQQQTDVSTLDPSFTSSRWYRPVGLALQLAAELYVSQDGTWLMVSNRGDKKLSGFARAENSIRIFQIQEEGRVLVPQGALAGISGPVRHFVLLENDQKLVAAVYQDPQCLQTYSSKKRETAVVSEDNTTTTTTTLGSLFQFTGEAKVKGVNVFCIAHS